MISILQMTKLSLNLSDLNLDLYMLRGEARVLKDQLGPIKHLKSSFEQKID